MASTYSSNLGIELIGTGDQSGTWGSTTNTNLGTLIEQAISGYVTQAVTTGMDTTITIPNGSSGVARNMYIELTGSGGASTNLIVPANKKLYFIFNNTSSGQVTVKVSGQTGISVPNGKKMILVSNGTDIVTAENYVASLSSDNLTLTGSLSVGTTSAFTGVATFTANPVLNGGTANGVLYLNGSKVATSGSALTFDGTNFATTALTQFNGNANTLKNTGELQWKDSGGTAQNVLFMFSDNNVYLSSPVASSSLIFRGPSYAELMRLDSSGNLGIGTTSPATKLEVTGDITQTWAASMDRFVGSKFSTTYELGLHFIESTRETRIVSKAADSTGLISFYTGVTPTQRAVIDSSGNLGVGEPFPGNFGKFAVSTSGTPTLAYASVMSTAGVYAGGFESTFYLGALRTDIIDNNQIGGYRFKVSSGSSAGANLSIEAGSRATGSTSPPNVFTPRVTLDASGNLLVGISTTTTGVSGSETSVVARGKDTTNTSASFVTVTNNGAGSGFLGTSGTTGDTYVFAKSNHALIFGTNNTERARIDSSGNLGLGVTPSAWVNATASQVGFGAAISSRAAGNTASDMTHNAFWDGSNWKYIASSVGAARYQMTGANVGSTHQWFTSAGGTAGNAISFGSAKMELTAAGDLQIGGTGSGARLVVRGSGTTSSTFSIEGANSSGATRFLVADDGLTRFYKADNGETARFTGTGEFFVGATAQAYAEKFRMSGNYAVFGDGTYTALMGRGASLGTGAGSDFAIRSENALAFLSGGANECGRFTSGGVFIVGTAGALYGELLNVTNGGVGKNCATFYFNTTDDRGNLILRHARASGATQAAMIAFLDSGGTERGSIKTDGSATAYNTSSDRRLKENIEQADDAGEIIDLIEIVKHDWKDGGHVRYGMIAQELHKVAPEAVSAGDDGEEIESTWGVDYSKLVPMLVKEIQSLRSRVAALEAK